MKPECKTCRFFVKWGNAEDDSRAIKYGECRINPPTVVGTTSGNDMQVEAESVFPTPYALGHFSTREDPWCGKYQEVKA